MWEFQKIRLPKYLRNLAETCLSRLNERSGKQFHLARLFLGRTLGHCGQNAWLIPVTTHSRPPSNRIVCIRTTPPAKSLVPSECAADFFEVCELLGVSNMEDVAFLYELVGGRVHIRDEELCKPRQVLDAKSAEQFGICIECLPEVLVSPETSTWWQPCGGELYVLRIDPNLRQIQRVSLASGVGNARIPRKLLR